MAVRPDMPMGERIAYWRQRRGLTQRVLADLIGRSESWLSQVERGIRSVDRMSVMVDLASVLQVKVIDLTGQPLSLAPNGGVEFDPINDIRHALLPYDVIAHSIRASGHRPSNEPPNLDQLRRDTAAAWDLWEASHYVELGGRIPELLDRAKTAARELSGDQRHAADALLADAYNLTSATLHKVDEHELAWIASDRAMAAAERAESVPLIGASTWWLAHIFLRSGRIEEATGLLKTGIDALEPSLSHADPAHLSVWGAMLLTGAVTAAKRNDRADAWSYVREAEQAAQRLGRDANHLATAFGPTNVALRTVAVPVELGDAGEALQVARTIDPSPLAPGLLERRAMFHIDVARAYGQRPNDAAAVATLLEAERVAPEEIHYHVVVRELLRELLKRERRSATPGLRPLAQRVGVL
jgi:transcriptional regulator with XRE-family HTH domain